MCILFTVYCQTLPVAPDPRAQDLGWFPSLTHLEGLDQCPARTRAQALWGNEWTAGRQGLEIFPLFSLLAAFTWVVLGRISYLKWSFQHRQWLSLIFYLSESLSIILWGDMRDTISEKTSRKGENWNIKERNDGKTECSVPSPCLRHCHRASSTRGGSSRGLGSELPLLQTSFLAAYFLPQWPNPAPWGSLS